MAFRTQQIPLVTAIAQVHVLQAYAQWAIKLFRDTSLPMRVRHGLATVLKAVMVQHSQAAALAISERCGAQGLFAHNQITNLHVRTRSSLCLHPSDGMAVGNYARNLHRGG